MSIDDFPFNNFIEQGKKVEFKTLIQKVHTYLLEKREEQARILDMHDNALIKNIMEIYIEMGYVKEEKVILTISKTDPSNIRWSTGAFHYILDLKNKIRVRTSSMSDFSTKKV